MADFARWVEAGAPAFGWKPGRFLAAYSLNRKEADQIALDMLPVGPAVQVFMEKRPEWEGEPSALLAGQLANDAVVLCQKQTQSVQRGRAVKV